MGRLLLPLLVLLVGVHSQTNEEVVAMVKDAAEEEGIGAGAARSALGDAAAEVQNAEEIMCDKTPAGFEDVDATTQNTIDKWIQALQGNKAGDFIKRMIGRNLKNPNSPIRKMLGKLIQDPNDDNFEGGAPDNVKPIPGPLVELIRKVYGDTKTVVGYLRSFGFFGKVLNKSPNALENYNGQIPPCAITEAIKEFQLYNGLEPDGILTQETRDTMRKERCGNPDVGCETPECVAKQEEEGSEEYLHRRKRYAVVSGRKWKAGDFTYFFEGYTEDMDRQTVRSEIEKALKEWTDVAKVTFTEVDNPDSADILIDFGAGDHGDKYAFSGPGGVLAHGFYPRKGHMHFDEDEYYTANQYSGTNLYYVATHEFGHVLGIMHSNIRGTVMYPYYPGFREDIRLHDDDIRAAETLFGAGTGYVSAIGSGSSGDSAGSGDRGGGGGVDNLEVKEPTEESKGPDNLEMEEAPKEEECISRIDAAFNHPMEKYAYIISGGQYFRLEADENNMPVQSEGYPKTVDEQWPGVSGEVEAAFTNYYTKKTVFFMLRDSGRVVSCWDWEANQMDFVEQPVSDTEFSGLPGDEEIKGVASYRDHVFFLFANEYYLYNSESGLGEAQTWPNQNGEKAVHVSGAFDAFLRGYFYTGSEDQPEKYILFRSRNVVANEAGVVTRYSYRRFEEDMSLEVCGGD